jgi:DNA-binding MarR family transcriptional regulator
MQQLWKLMDNKKRGFSQPAFLLAQVGAHAASKFTDRLAALELTPPDAGILRLLRAANGISQQELSGKLGIHPSRLVAVLDGLEEKGLVERRANEDDRRQYSLRLTERGAQALEQVGQVARQHQDALLAALSREERERLAELLTKIADEQGLTPGVHPGYRWMKPR